MNCTVITPVGPGHSPYIERCKDSVAKAIYTDKGPFEVIDHIIIDDTNGQLGRSAARNKAVRQSRSEWIFFLDADDLLAERAFENVSDYISCGLDAVFGVVVEIFNGILAPRERQVLAISSYDDLMKIDPYLSIQMGHFVKRAVAVQLPFNEKMDCGEDFDYYLRLWKNFRCRKVPRIFFINVRGNHSTGPRSANGRQRKEMVDKLMGKRPIIIDADPVEKEEREKNILAAMKRRLPTLSLRNPRPGEWCVCAGGPSLEKEIKKISRHQKKGAAIVSVNGSHDFLVNRGIVPNAHIMCDPRSSNVRFVRHPNEKTAFYISGECHPIVFDALLGNDLRVWYPTGYKSTECAPVTVGGGSTVGLRAINIGYILGFRKIHLYGMDGCVREKHHAYSQPENDGESVRDVFVDDQSYLMTDWMIAQAQNFQEMMQSYGDTFSLRVHSPGIIKYIAENYHRGSYV